jgi:hypothetical protein
MLGTYHFQCPFGTLLGPRDKRHHMERNYFFHEPNAMLVNQSVVLINRIIIYFKQASHLATGSTNPLMASSNQGWAIIKNGIG